MSIKYFLWYSFIYALCGFACLFFLNFSNESIVLFLLVQLLVSNSFVNLYTADITIKKYSYYDFLERYIPLVVITLLILLVSGSVSIYREVLLSLVVIIVFSWSQQGLFFIFRAMGKLHLGQVVSGVYFLVMITGVLFVSSLSILMTSYDQKNKVYQFFVRMNPMMVICDLFDIDPSHRNRLYGIFGSSFLTPKASILSSLALWVGVGVLFWLIYFLWFHPSEPKTTSEVS